MATRADRWGSGCSRKVDFILLRLFLAGAEPFTVRVAATARPLRGP